MAKEAGQAQKQSWIKKYWEGRRKKVVCFGQSLLDASFSKDQVNTDWLTKKPYSYLWTDQLTGYLTR